MILVPSLVNGFPQTALTRRRSWFDPTSAHQESSRSGAAFQPRMALDSSEDSAQIPREVVPSRRDQAEKQGWTKPSRRPVPQLAPGPAMIPAIRAASRPTPWICSDDFE